MTDDQISSDLMDYASLTQNALRGVIRQALQRAASPQGLPGEHHFYVTFLTRGSGVSVPEDLLARYPYDITIVLQHQYRDLRVADDFFRVTLTFGGAPKVLTVPYAAITRFHDPFAQFMLEFEVEDSRALTQDTDPADMLDDGSEPEVAAPDLASPAASEAKETEAPDDAPKVISLDHFRKK
ncbi:hypothetical protein ABI_23420 [Asticcacaulis biprosthecium C19]|uniref:Stringent starvation protein B n=1 Tax=Asticcacaulis biprosthecium C19 TaxID=715226 RepID=F4QNM2_9CAUL|nr:ClpXP protease specificity-enhancing factor SspB [Asticcacaulis biprosthecium]EGF90930.1 hypothetical protein ABI_23420 [Asticcacaulis biprosthecium C19]